MAKGAETRTVDVFVRDREDAPIDGATIRFRMNNEDCGEVNNAEGRGRIEKVPWNTPVEVTVVYKGEEKTAKIAGGQQAYTFTYDTVVRPKDKHLGFWFGLVLVGVAAVLAFSFQNMNPIQTKIVQALLSLGCGGFANEVAGLLNVKMTTGRRIVVTATGALAVFVILWFTNARL
jgi:hypothetical protein